MYSSSLYTHFQQTSYARLMLAYHLGNIEPQTKSSPPSLTALPFPSHQSAGVLASAAEASLHTPGFEPATCYWKIPITTTQTHQHHQQQPHQHHQQHHHIQPATMHMIASSGQFRMIGSVAMILIIQNPIKMPMASLHQHHDIVSVLFGI